jgi:MFS family permease
VASILVGITDDFHLTHTQGGWLFTLFILVYMVAAPLGGYLGDRMPRKVLIAVSVFVWSLATIGSGLAPSFGWLMVARAAVGIGEAGYGTVTPGLISDLYPRDLRTRMLSVFYTAMPVGAALGFAVGGWVMHVASWHVAFYVGGIPGILLAVAALFMKEPERGATEIEPLPEKVPFVEGLRALSRNGVFWVATAGLTLMTFSVGGLADWMPTFLERDRQMGVHSSEIFGAVTLLAGLLGTLAGGWLGERAERKSHTGGLWVSGIALALSAPFVFLAASVTGSGPIFAMVFGAQFLIFMNTGPLNAAICNFVTPDFRSFAMGINTLILHLLGDALSPVVIGAIADQTHSLETAIHVNALPVLLSGVVLVVGARYYRRRSQVSVATAA